MLPPLRRSRVWALFLLTLFGRQCGFSTMKGIRRKALFVNKILPQSFWLKIPTCTDFCPRVMEPDELRRKVLQLSQVKHTLTKPELFKVLKLSHAIRTFLRRRLEELAVSSHGPSMLVVMSDGWGASITKTIKLKFPGSHVTITKNREVSS